MFDVYRPSGSIGMMTYPLFLVGIVLSLLLAFVYQFLLDWIPLIYVSFLITLGLGMGLGMLGSFIVNIGHCRNVLMAGLLGITLATVGIGAKFLFQYQRDYQALNQIETVIKDAADLTDAEVAETLEAIKQRKSFSGHVQDRVDSGWNIGRGGRGGLPIQGVFVYLIWLIEAGIIYYFSVTLPAGSANEPYSEKMNAWADESQVVMSLPITDPEMVSKIQSASSVDDLLEIPIPKTDQSNQVAVYTVNSIPGEELEDAYLSVTSLTYSINSKGEQETKEEPLVKHAVLSSEKRKQLIENAELLQEALAEYRASLIEEGAAEDVEVVENRDAE